MFFRWCGICPKETKRSTLHASEDSDSYEFFVLGGVLKITHGEIVPRMGRSMVILPLDCLNG